MSALQRESLLRGKLDLLLSPNTAGNALFAMYQGIEELLTMAPGAEQRALHLTIVETLLSEDGSPAKKRQKCPGTKAAFDSNERSARLLLLLDYMLQECPQLASTLKPLLTERTRSILGLAALDSPQCAKV